MAQYLSLIDRNHIKRRKNIFEKKISLKKIGEIYLLSLMGSFKLA
jgi:hypothetical protein